MKEIVHFRLTSAETAIQVLREFDPDRVLPDPAAFTPQEISFDREDPRLAKFAEIYKRIEPLAWFSSERIYSPEELLNAEALLLSITELSMETGNECGTVYDETQVCPYCKRAKRKQASDLFLNLRKAPKRTDMATTLHWDEWVVSERLYNILQAYAVTGCEFAPVLPKASRRPIQNLPRFYQLKITASAGWAAPPTQFGINPFDLSSTLYILARG